MPNNRVKIKKKAAEQTNLNDYKIIVNKCFNIIRMLMHSKIFVVKNLQKIEESFAPLVEYMNEPSKIDFDEDIVEIINNLIIHNQHLTKLSLVVIEHLYKYCKKIEGLLLDMYELINAYLAYGTDVILSNEKYMNLNGTITIDEYGISASSGLEDLLKYVKDFFDTDDLKTSRDYIIEIKNNMTYFEKNPKSILDTLD